LSCPLIRPGKLLSLAITKHILLDTYKECYRLGLK
jgi:hypothetical protein